MQFRSQWVSSQKTERSITFHYSGNMSRGILWSRISGSIMERRLQIEVYGLLWKTAIHTETDLYYRWVALCFFLAVSRDVAKRKINLKFALSNRPAHNGQSWQSSLCFGSLVQNRLWTSLPTNFLILNFSPNIESILLNQDWRLFVPQPPPGALMKHMRTVHGEIPFLIEDSSKIDYLASISITL